MFRFYIKKDTLNISFCVFYPVSFGVKRGNIPALCNFHLLSRGVFQQQKKPVAVTREVN